MRKGSIDAHRAYQMKLRGHTYATIGRTLAAEVQRVMPYSAEAVGRALRRYEAWRKEELKLNDLNSWHKENGNG